LASHDVYIRGVLNARNMTPCPKCGSERPGYHVVCPQCGLPPHFPMHYTQVFNDEEIAEIEREQMPEQPKKPPTPTFEDILRELGPEKMSFMSEMLRPDAEDERRTDAAGYADIRGSRAPAGHNRASRKVFRSQAYPARNQSGLKAGTLALS